jgi:hypothetical protein
VNCRGGYPGSGGLFLPYSCGTAPDFRWNGHRLPLGHPSIRALDDPCNYSFVDLSIGRDVSVVNYMISFFPNDIRFGWAQLTVIFRL